MPWEKKFRTEEVLTKAMHAFWARGYEATSMRDLVECMGINRASIYATFGDKRGLFIRALRHYDDRHREAFLDGLRGRPSAKGAITGAFESVVSTALEGGARDGCLLVNTALELSPHDEEVAEIVGRGLSEVEAFFHEMIERGRAAGEIPPEVDATETARALLSTFVGLRVLSRSRPEEGLLKSVALQAKALLE